jgi:hypothetical protein
MPDVRIAGCANVNRYASPSPCPVPRDGRGATCAPVVIVSHCMRGGMVGRFGHATARRPLFDGMRPTTRRPVMSSALAQRYWNKG